MSDGATRDLAIDYVNGAGEARGLLRGSPTRHDLLQRAKALRGRRVHPTVLEILRHAEGSRAADESREQALSRLADGALVVAAGQQPALFGGPLLTMYKVATAVRLADWLTSEGIDAVPLFWCASEDHDFDEANRLYWLSDDGSTTTLFHAPLSGRGHGLDDIVLDPRTVSEIESWFDSNVSPAPTDMPRVGETIGEWTLRLVARWFAGRGLLVVEPRSLAAPLEDHWQAVLDQREGLREAFLRATDDVAAAGYRPRLDRPADDSTLLFLRTAEGRRRLAWREGRLFAGSSPVEDDSLAAGITLPAPPDRFSSSAAIRPLTQHVAFPVAAQVCGPSEIAYLAQVMPLFELFNLTPPIAWPRFSATLITEQDEAWRVELGLTPEQLVGDPDAWPQPDDGLPPDFEQAHRDIRGPWLELLEPKRGEDVFIAQSRAGLRRSVLKALRDFEKSLRKEARRRDRPRASRRHRLRERTHPRGRPQERLLTPSAFSAWPTEHLVSRVIAEADPDRRDHAVILLEDKERHESAEL